MKTISDRAFFERRDDGYFVGGDAARGPWSSEHCHAGPVSGLLARAAERLVEDKQLTRLSVDILRAVPLNGIRIEASIKKSGRTLATVEARAYDRENRVCCVGNTVHMATGNLEHAATVSVSRPHFSEATPGPFPMAKRAHSLPSFGMGCEIAYPPGENENPGPTTVWLKTLPLVGGEKTSPFQSLCPIGDCGNAFSRNADPDVVSFMNLDLTIHLFRPPESRWLASRAESYWEPSGIGLSRALLFDKKGAVGQATQSLLLRSQAG